MRRGRGEAREKKRKELVQRRLVPFTTWWVFGETVEGIFGEAVGWTVEGATECKLLVLQGNVYNWGAPTILKWGAMNDKRRSIPTRTKEKPNWCQEKLSLHHRVLRSRQGGRGNSP